MRRSNKLLKIFVFTLVFSILFLTGLYVYRNRYIDSGFVFIRVARWIYNIEIIGETNFDLYFQGGVVFGELYLVSASKILGEKLIDLLYIPIFTTLSVLLFYFFVRIFIKNKKYAILLAITILFLTEGQRGHFREYSIGIFLYPVFVGLIAKYIKEVDLRYLFISIFVLLSLKFYSPHYEVWAVSFLISFVLILYVIKNTKLFQNFLKDKSIKKHYKTIRNFTIISVIFLFAHQPKGMGFLHRTYQGVYSPNIVQEINYYIQNIISPGEGVGLEYGASTQAPFLPRMFNIIITLSLALLLGYIFIKFIWLIIIKKHKKGEHNFNLLEILLFLSIIGVLPHGFLYLSIGQSSYLLRPIYLIGPVLIVYFSNRLTSKNKNNKSGMKNNSQKKLTMNPIQKTNYFKKFVIMTIVMIIILSVAYHVSFFYYEIPRPLGADETNNSMSSWFGENTEDPSILTDHHTYGLTLAYMRNNNYSDGITFEHYTDARYSFIIGKGNLTERQEIDYVLINKMNQDRTMQSEDWRHFEPIKDYIEQIESNRYLNKVYSSNNYIIYQVEA